MTTIFFLLSIVFILHEFYTMPFLNREFYDQLHENAKDKDKAKRSALVKEHPSYFLVMLMYVVWLFIGTMMASQWIFFAVILGLSFLGAGLRKILPEEVMAFYKNVDVTVTVTILMWVTWHHFHN
jgi:hypothetical protein